MAIHLRDIFSTQEIFENTKDSPKVVSQMVENGKKIYSALRAQNKKYQLEKDDEIFDFIFNARTLDPQQIYKLQFREIMPEKSPRIDTPKLKKGSRETLSFSDDLGYVKKLSSPNLFQNSTFEHKINTSFFDYHVFEHPERISFYRIANNFFSSYFFKLSLQKKEYIDKWNLWKQLNNTLEGDFEEKHLLQQMKEISSNYFDNHTVIFFF